MGDKDDERLGRLVDAVLLSSKYKNVCKDLVRSIGFRELTKRHTLKEAIKATRNTLHQVGGAYLERGAPYGVWLDELREASRSRNRDLLRNACRNIMGHHSSTRERLQILGSFYAITLADLSPIRTVVDVACGLNPLAVPWMPLAEDATYYAYDIYQDMVNFLNECMALLEVQGHAQVCDVTQGCPAPRGDVAFVLKTLPCLEQITPSASFQLLNTIRADHLLVSFPVRSLGGRDKGMVNHYEGLFRERVADAGWSIRRFEFATELAFRVTK